MYTSHGHHIRGTIKDEDPKSVARCGGPGLCSKCSVEASAYRPTPEETWPKTLSELKKAPSVNYSGTQIGTVTSMSNDSEGLVVEIRLFPEYVINQQTFY